MCIIALRRELKSITHTKTHTICTQINHCIKNKRTEYNAPTYYFSRKRKRAARKYIKKEIKVQKDPKIHGTKKAALRRPITSINETIHDKNTATKTALQLSS